MAEPIRIMIADDHEVVREGLGTFLAEEGDFDVVGFACDGEEAVATAIRENPDVILMDLLMPRLDGLGAIRRLQEVGSEAAVLVLTTYIEEAMVRDALAGGALGYLLKDVHREELVSAIRSAASGRTTLHPEAQQLLVEHIGGPAAASPFASLTEREHDVLRLIASGKSNKAIARELFLSVGTVKGYVSQVLAKLCVRDRTQAALLAVKEGIVDLDRSDH